MPNTIWESFANTNIVYGEKRALIASTVLLWVTQIDLLEFVTRSKRALQRYALEEEAVFITKKGKAPNPIKVWLVNSDFWSALDLINIPRPIHDAQKASERNGATIDWYTQGG